MSNQATCSEALAVRPEEFTLSRYDVMIAAIAECANVDEVKGIRDKAEALRVYAKQAGSFQSERLAEYVRLRAEHRAGQLLKQAKAEGRLGAGRPRENGTAVEPFLESVGITKKQSSTWQLFSDIPWDYVIEQIRVCKRATAHSLTAKRAAESAGVQEGAPLKTIQVHFKTLEDMEDFARRIEQKVTMGTKSIWHPKEKPPYKMIKINFATLEDREDFAKLIGKKITSATHPIPLSGADLDAALERKAQRDSSASA